MTIYLEESAGSIWELEGTVITEPLRLISASSTTLPTPDELRLGHIEFSGWKWAIEQPLGYTPLSCVVLTYYELWEESAWENTYFETRTKSALDFETAIVTPDYTNPESEIQIYLGERETFHKAVGIVAPELEKLVMKNCREVTLEEALRAGWQTFLPKHVKEQLER